MNKKEKDIICSWKAGTENGGSHVKAKLVTGMIIEGLMCTRKRTVNEIIVCPYYGT
jgi:hypothetical protein